MTIASILQGKGGNVVSVDPEATGKEVAETLTRHRIGAVLVKDRSGTVVGIVSERDLVRAMAAAGRAPDAIAAEEMMTRALATVTPASTIAEALGLMTDRRIRHLPVMEEGVLRGMVSIGDLVKARIEAAEREAQALRDYVTTG